MTAARRRVRRTPRARALGAIGLAAGVLVGACAWPASAQHRRLPASVGVLTDARATNHPVLDGLKAGLRQLGFEEGRDVVYDVRLTDASPGRMPGAAAALVLARADVIFTAGEAATLAVVKTTRSIPVVFTLVGDPVAAGLVDSLARPGANITGVSNLAVALVPKQLETLKAVAPAVRRVWAVHLGAEPGSSAAIERVREASSRLAMEVVPWPVRTPGDLDGVVGRAGFGDAFLVPDVAALDIAASLLEASLARRIPAVFPSDLWVARGGLLSIGADYRDQGIQAARLVAKILRGAPPRDLPVEAAERVLLTVNLKTAAAFGLVPPRDLLFRADLIRR